MTTSILSPESDALVSPAQAPAAVSTGYVTYRIRHTLASRFAFLMVCLAIILSALAYGTVHYWALGIFFLGGVTILILWLIDSWNLGTFRISRNVLQLPLLGMFLLGVFQLLPLRHPEDVGTHSIPLVSSLSFDPYSTRLILVQIAALAIYFAAVLVFTDTPQTFRRVSKNKHGGKINCEGRDLNENEPGRVGIKRETAHERDGMGAHVLRMAQWQKLKHSQQKHPEQG